MADTAIPTRRYLVQEARGTFVLELPETWKLTFGAVNPGAGAVGHRDLHCLRVWEAKEKLRAVFCDVRGFRDLGIPLARKMERETGSAEWTSDSTGNFERTARRQVESGFTIEELETDPFEGNE